MKLSEARVTGADGRTQMVRRYPVGFFTQLFGRTGDQRGVAESMVVLLAGPPGAGKTTLLLMLCELLLEQITPEEGGGVWIANEMSPEELLAFAERLRLKHIDRITVVNAMGGLDFDLMSTLKSLKPRFTILDSLSSLVGEGGGADEAGERIVKQFKKHAVEEKSPALIVNQVNKRGDFAGFNNTLHAGDALFYLDKDDTDGRRVLYSEKNRFGQSPVELNMRMMPDESNEPGRFVIDHVWYEAKGEEPPNEFKELKVIALDGKAVKMPPPKAKEDAAVVAVTVAAAGEKAKTRKPRKRPSAEPPGEQHWAPRTVVTGEGQVLVKKTKKKPAVKKKKAVKKKEKSHAPRRNDHGDRQGDRARGAVRKARRPSPGAPRKAREDDHAVAR
jgi:energy-coupling factor transporter ATP-binding protein EcfA2